MSPSILSTQTGAKQMCTEAPIKRGRLIQVNHVSLRKCGPNAGRAQGKYRGMAKLGEVTARDATMIGNPTTIAAPVEHFAGVYPRARRGWTDSSHSRCDCDAEPKATGSSPSSRNGLLLGACSRFRHDVRTRILPLEPGLSPIHSGVSVVCRGDDWPDGKAKTLTILAAHSYDRNGCALRADDYRLLCG